MKDSKVVWADPEFFNKNNKELSSEKWQPITRHYFVFLSHDNYYRFIQYKKNMNNYITAIICTTFCQIYLIFGVCHHRSRKLKYAYDSLQTEEKAYAMASLLS